MFAPPKPMRRFDGASSQRGEDLLVHRSLGGEEAMVPSADESDAALT